MYLVINTDHMTSNRRAIPIVLECLLGNNQRTFGRTVAVPPYGNKAALVYTVCNSFPLSLLTLPFLNSLFTIAQTFGQYLLESVTTAITGLLFWLWLRVGRKLTPK